MRKGYPSMMTASDRIVAEIQSRLPQCAECRMKTFHLHTCSKATPEQKANAARAHQLRRIRSVR